MPVTHGVAGSSPVRTAKSSANAGLFFVGYLPKKAIRQTTSKFSSTEKIHLDDCTFKKWHKAMGICIPMPRGILM
jgi:hypothetical protein